MTGTIEHKRLIRESNKRLTAIQKQIDWHKKEIELLTKKLNDERLY